MQIVEFLAKRGSRELFTKLKDFPRREFSINELAREADVPFVSAWRIVKLWERAGVIETGRLGRSVVVRYRESAYTRAISQTLHASLSPQAFTVARLKPILARNSDVTQAYLFGSVARGQENLSSDIDLALFAGKGFDAEGFAIRAYELYGTKVVPIVFSSAKDLNALLAGKHAVRLKGATIPQRR